MRLNIHNLQEVSNLHNRINMEMGDLLKYTSYKEYESILTNDLVYGIFDGELIGFITLQENSDVLNQVDLINSVYLKNVIIDPDYRRRGVFSRLLDEAIDELPDMDIDYLVCTIAEENMGSIRAFEKYGFTYYKKAKVHDELDRLIYTYKLKK